MLLQVIKQILPKVLELQREKNGVDKAWSKNVVKVKNPYVCEELLRKYDPNTTAVVYILEKKTQVD